MAKIKTRNSDSHKTKPKGVKKQAFERVYWPYIPIVFAISFLLMLSSNGGALKAAMHHPLGRVLSYSTSMSLGGLLSDTNAQRSANGAGALNLNNTLDAAAQAKADDMASRNYWSHNTPDGNPPWIFVNAQGYSYQKLGENLATGFSDEQSTINGWMASPPHRENLLDPAFSDVGFGFANNPDYTSAGGGPMTIIVAFYGKPQVLSASTVAPAPSTPAAAPTQSTPQSTSPSSQPTADSPSTPVAATDTLNEATSTKQAANTAAPTTNAVKSTPTSHLQLASPSTSYGGLATKLSIVLSVILVLMWANRHIRALHKFLIKGENYAIRHPLTDLGVLMIAAMLFILSQTAGLIQ